MFAASNALGSDSDLPDDPALFVRKNVGRKLVALARACRASCCPRNGGSRALHSMSVSDRRDRIRRYVNATGHHDDDAASVLGTVQGAALRSARAYARPSGLDRACAQMIGGQLRDRRRMLFPSGTNGALIDPSDGLEKRSYMFDRFRTRAFRPLVEVHFSRFCPLTSVASGASLFAFERCCDAPPSAFGHRRGAVVDRRPQGLNQQLPCDEQGNDRRCARRSSVAEAS